MKSIELFAGIGGISLAAEWAGIETVAFCEREPFCQKVLQKHWPDVPIFDDVKTLNKQALIDGGVDVGTIDIISGGYPCQGESEAGKRLASKDERWLWPEMFRIIKEVKPRWVIGENVAGHVNRGLRTVTNDLENEGYETQAFVISASSVGANHERKRVFVVGYSDSKSKLQKNQTASAVRKKWEAWESAAGKYRRAFSSTHWETDQPSVCRMDDGVSRGMDKSRLIALGNAVVPQQIYPIFKAISEIEKMESEGY